MPYVLEAARLPCSMWHKAKPKKHEAHPHSLVLTKVSAKRKLLSWMHLVDGEACDVCHTKGLQAFYTCKKGCKFNVCVDCVSGRTKLLDKQKKKQTVQGMVAAVLAEEDGGPRPEDLASFNGDEAHWNTQPFFKPLKHCTMTGPEVKCPSGHALRNVGLQTNGWVCQSVNCVGGCLSGITDVGQSADIVCFSCALCASMGQQYELCEQCYREKEEKRKCPKCSKMLRWQDFMGPGYEQGWICENSRSCGNGLMAPVADHPFRWRCADCSKDYCPACYNKLAMISVKCPKGHEMKDLGVTNTGWCCDGKQRPRGCRSGITDFGQTTGMKQYSCRACQYDLCEFCYEAQAEFWEPDSIVQVKKVDDLNPKALDFYKTLVIATSPGGQKTFDALMERHFNRYDVNRDGYLSMPEVEAVVNHLHGKLSLPPPPKTIVAGLFANQDPNDTGNVDLRAFRDLYRRILKLALSSLQITNREDMLRSAKRDFEKEYEIGRRLNAGAQGVTYLATERKSGRTVVVKKPNNVADTEDFDMLVHKSHPNIVRVFALFTSPLETFVVMECCAGGDLFKGYSHCIEAFGGMTYNFIAGAMHQVMAGVSYLHAEFKECHNDIKPENVLLDRKPAHPSDIPRCMVADFGCASLNGSGANGDPRYNAPELWFQGHVSYASDVWALGIMLYEMLSGGVLAFTDHMNISGYVAWIEYDSGSLAQKFVNAIQVYGAQPNWDFISDAGPEAIGLCQAMLAYERRGRISLSNAMAHPWFNIESRGPQAIPAEIGANLQRRARNSELKMVMGAWRSKTAHAVWRQLRFVSRCC